jgi:carboxyl-terminal processing protease
MVCGIVNIIMRELRTPLLVIVAVAAAAFFWAGCQTEPGPPPAPLAKVGKIQPEAGAARIAFFTALLLEKYHYSQHPLDTEMSQKFFDGYLDLLDGRHEHFLQSDLDEFSAWRTNLDKLTLGSGNQADLTPAYAIYSRFAERFQQHIAYVSDLLKHEKFKFAADEKYVFDRRHEPFPKDLDAAKNLWRQRLRYEYLQEKLSHEISETNGTFTVKLPAGAMTNFTETALRHYRWQMRQSTNRDASDVLQFYLDALAHAYDPHSDYFSAPKAQDFSMQMNLSLFGIGAKLQEDDGFCVIKELVPGGPAMKSKKLKVEDRIVAVAQAGKPPVDVVDMDLSKVVQMIRGQKNTEVRITVVSPAENRTQHRDITLVRDEIKLEDSEAKAKLIEQPDGRRFGIIDLPSFYAPVNLDRNGDRAKPKFTSADVAKLIEKLKSEKISGLILDLRSNPGGSLEEAVKFTGLFIKDGPVVLARNPNGQVLPEADRDPEQLYDGPLLVMVNRFSASASEIAAAALQDYGRALIVGDSSTHGKGTVQNLNPLQPIIEGEGGGVTGDPGTLKITIRKFYRINGGSTQFKGVVPDIILPNTWNYSTVVGESAMENALPWDTIRAVPHTDYALTQPFIPALLAGSEARVRGNADFKYINEDIEQMRKLQLDKSATLNEQDAIQERERVALQNKAREKERNARPPLAEKFYDLSLKDAELNGLPAPLPENTNSIAAGSSGKAKPAFAVKSIKLDRGFNSVAADDKPKIYKPRPGDDAALEEAEHILNDYVSLLVKSNVLTTK